MIEINGFHIHKARIDPPEQARMVDEIRSVAEAAPFIRASRRAPHPVRR